MRLRHGHGQRRLRRAERHPRLQDRVQVRFGRLRDQPVHPSGGRHGDDHARELPRPRAPFRDAPARVRPGGLRRGRREPALHALGRHDARPRDRLVGSGRGVDGLGERPLAHGGHDHLRALGAEGRLQSAGVRSLRDLAGLRRRLAHEPRREQGLRLLGQRL